MTTPPYASVRVTPLRTLEHIHAMSRHSLRVDAISQERLRPSAIMGTALTWTSRKTDALDPAFDPNNKEHVRNVFEAFKRHKARLNIGETKNGGVGLHVMTVVSERYFAETGDVHNPNNPRIKAVFEESIKWAEHTFGEGSVYMARMDLDEFGTGVVDMFLTPHRIDGRSRNSKNKICSSKVLVEIAHRAGVKMSYRALQSGWASWCQERLSSEILRGRRREETGADHLPVDLFKAVLAAERDRAEKMAAKEIERILEEAGEESRQIVEDAETFAENTRLDLEQDAARDRESMEGDYAITRLEISQQSAALQNHQAELDRRSAELDRKRVELERLIAETRANLIAQGEALAETNRIKRLTLDAFETVKSWLAWIGPFTMGLKEAQRFETATTEMIDAVRSVQEQDSPTGERQAASMPTLEP